MKKITTKGFTLIELLAVIVILAVIALIATPIIMNVINDSKEGSAKDSMYGYVKAVELSTINTVTATTDAPDGVYKANAGNLVMDTETLNVNFKGSKPKDNGYVSIVNGHVVESGLEFDGYCIKYDGSKADVSKDCSVPTPAPSKTYTVGEEVYFDPTGAVSDCNASKIWTPTNTGTTCYKWNVITDNGSSVEMLLDHNTTAILAWVSKEDYIAAGGTEAEYETFGNNKYGPLTAIKQLKTDTTSWSKVETLTSTDNVTNDANGGSKYTINYNGMKARLISGQEVATIGKDTVWTPDNVTATVYSASPWLYQNTYSNGDNSNYGYWTDTAYPSIANYAWHVLFTGSLDRSRVYYASDYASDFGVRPVVRALKSNI